MMTIDELKQKRPAFKDLTDYLEQYNPGDKLPGQQRIADETGWDKSIIREQFRVLECLHYVDIQHGKYTILLKRI